MTQTTPIRLTEFDFHNLQNLLDRLSQTQRQQFEHFEDEIFRAEIIPSEQVTPDLVTMYSRVQFKDLENNKVSEIQLTYPEDSCIEQGRVSVLAPIGTAILGLSIGQTITWHLPNERTKTLLITNIIEQPEQGANQRQSSLLVS